MAMHLLHWLFFPSLSTSLIFGWVVVGGGNSGSGGVVSGCQCVFVAQPAVAVVCCWPVCPLCLRTLPASWAEDYNRKNLKHGTFEPHEAEEVQVRGWAAAACKGVGTCVCGGGHVDWAVCGAFAGHTPHHSAAQHEQ